MLKNFTGPGMLRLILAELVFLHHMTRLAVGSAAVLIFFTLSGYWIYRMYTGRYAKTRSAYFTYLISRGWRLLPTFWLIAALTLLFVWRDGTLSYYWYRDNPVHFVFSHLLILGYNSLCAQPMVPAWSLDIEVQFYFIAPLAIVLLASRRLPAQLWLALAACVSLAFAFTGNKIPLASYLFFFIFGMVAASLDWRPSGKLAMMSLGIIAALFAICLISPWRAVLLVGAHPTPLAAYTQDLNVVLAVIVLPYAIYTTGRQGFSFDGMCGDLSYVIYLLHWCAAIWLGKHQGSLAHRAFNAAEAWLVVSAMSLLIWKLYDHPINRLRSRWVSSRVIAKLRQPPALNDL
jgi:peptidoglycan/LPS O-acetylase OafA/YrhL